MRILLVFDVHNLCYRAWHALPALSSGSRFTEVVFGFLRSVELLSNEYATRDFAFCFDHTVSIRKEIFPDYKSRRRDKLTPEECKARARLAEQINRLRQDYLPQAGCLNVYQQHGVESDDLMAAIARRFSLIPNTEIVLVSSDNDLFQCLSENVMIHLPGKRGSEARVTHKSFLKKYGLQPHQWAHVKAIAGCKTDSVPGVPGVGEVTALKYIRGELVTTSTAYHKIRSPQAQAVIRRNRQLVELPLPECREREVFFDLWDGGKWKEMQRNLGMRSRIL